MGKDIQPLPNKSNPKGKGAGNESEATSRLPYKTRLRYQPLRRNQRAQYHVISRYRPKAPALDPNRFDWILEEFLSKDADHESSGHISSPKSQQQKQMGERKTLRVKTLDNVGDEDLEQISRALQHSSLNKAGGSLDKEPEPSTDDHQQQAPQCESLDATIQGPPGHEKQADSPAESNADLNCRSTNVYEQIGSDTVKGVVLHAPLSGKD